VESDVTAHRESAKDDFLEFEMIEEGDDGFGVSIQGRGEVGRKGRMSEAEEIREEKTEALAQIAEGTIPERAVERKAVEEEKSAVALMDLRGVRRDEHRGDSSF